MPSDAHEALYQKLRDNNERVKTALAKRDPETLISLSAEHRLIMNQLKNAGDTQDPHLFDSIKVIKRDFEAVLGTIRKERNEVLREMQAIDNKRKLKQAYGA